MFCQLMHLLLEEVAFLFQLLSFEFETKYLHMENKYLIRIKMYIHFFSPLGMGRVKNVRPVNLRSRKNVRSSRFFRELVRF